MNRLLTIAAAGLIVLSAVSYSRANVEAQVEVDCVPQVQLQAVAPQPQVYAYAVAPQPTVQVAVAPQVQAYQVRTKEKRPGLLNRIKAFRNAPRRQVQTVEPVAAVAPVAVQAVPQTYVAPVPVEACIGVSQ